MYPYKVLPYSIQAIAYNLVTNPMYSTVFEPVHCTLPGCQSYLLSGGGMFTTPPFPSALKTSKVMVIPNVISRQVDFSPGLAHGDEFHPSDCTVYADEAGGTIIAAKVCIAHSLVNKGSIIAGNDYLRA